MSQGNVMGIKTEFWSTKVTGVHKPRWYKACKQERLTVFLLWASKITSRII